MLAQLLNGMPHAAGQAPASPPERHMPSSLEGVSAAGPPGQQHLENRPLAGAQGDGIRLALKQTQDVLAAQQANNMQLQQEVTRLKAAASNNAACITDLKQELDAGAASCYASL